MCNWKMSLFLSLTHFYLARQTKSQLQHNSKNPISIVSPLRHIHIIAYEHTLIQNETAIISHQLVHNKERSLLSNGCVWYGHVWSCAVIMGWLRSWAYLLFTDPTLSASINSLSSCRTFWRHSQRVTYIPSHHALKDSHTNSCTITCMLILSYRQT